ncbi:tetratricopeptide repeat protein [Kangiella shandongensis]|uniref:tetratricopeptide repeat protein n=1 Tax=Kangiella shandongensis TaxID=2763258 RepID=UPI001CBFBA99|nr:tetratricopeptide repeat protein [Kangiella shandongensis]
MNFSIRKISYIILIPLLLTAWFVRADYYQQLKVIEEQRLDDLASTKTALEEIAEKKAEFSDEEKYLYTLLKAHSEVMHSNFAEAEKLLQEIIKSDAKHDYKGRAYSILASVQQIQGKYVYSFMNLDRALALIPKMENKVYKTNILQNALSFYNDSGMLDYAMEYARRLLKHGVEDKNLADQCQAYFEMAVIELSADKVELADSRLEKTYDICHKAKGTLPLLHLPNMEAEIALGRGQLTKAKELLEANYPKVKEYGWKILNASTEIHLAEVFFILQDYEKSEELALKALKTAEEISDVKRSKNATQVLAKLYSELEKKEEAIKYYQKYMELEQKLNTSSRQRKLAYDQARQRLRAEQLARLEEAN